MSDKTLQEQEIEMLQENKEILDLESLIVDGVNAKVPVEVEYQGKTYGAVLKPLTNVEWNNASRKAIKNNKTTSEIELLKKGLFTKNDEEFPAEILIKLPQGVVGELAKELARISGVNLTSEENQKLMRELMGF